METAATGSGPPHRGSSKLQIYMSRRLHSSPRVWAFILLTLIVFLSYGNSLENGFTYDDEGLIVHNALIKNVSDWPRLFTTHYWAGIRDPSAGGQALSGLYRPLTSLSYAVNYAVRQADPFWYHAVNVLSHLVVVWLLFLLALDLGLGLAAAAVAAAVFAAHPIHTEAVAGVAGRAELMMAAGFLASLWFMVRGRSWASLLAYCFALGSKEQAITLLPVLLLFDLTAGHVYQGQGFRTALRIATSRYLPYVLATGAYLGLRGWMITNPLKPNFHFLANPLGTLELYQRWIGATQIAGWYLWLCVWPSVLSFDYSYNAIPLAGTLLDPVVLLSAGVWLALFALALWSCSRAGAVTFSIGLLFFPFLPVSNLVVPIGTIMGERLFYLPSAGICLLLGTAFQALMVWCRRRPGSGKGVRAGAWLLVVLACAALVWRTVARNREWYDTEHLVRSAARAYPQNARLYSILGRMAKDQEDWDAALDYFKTAVRIYPDYLRTGLSLNTNLGIALIRKGFVEEGVEAIERAAQIDPHWSQVHYNLGLAYKTQGRYREAEAAYERALGLNNRDPRALTGLSFLYLEIGRYDDALGSADRALRRDPDYVEALYTRARALELLKRFEQAADAYARIVELHPERENIARKVEELRQKTP